MGQLLAVKAGRQTDLSTSVVGIWREHPLAPLSVPGHLYRVLCRPCSCVFKLY